MTAERYLRCALRTLLLLLSVVVAFPAVAQDSSLARVSIAGVVRDTTGRPLSGAEVRSGERITLTSDSGTFLLADLMPDTVGLTVRRIGYRPVETAFVIRPGYTITVAVKMTPSEVTLGTIVVEGKRMDARLWKTGFYHRDKMGSGTFFTPDYIEHHGSSVSGLIAEVPSVRIERDVRGRAKPIGRFGGSECAMNVFIDGTLARWAPDVGLDAVLPKSDILAVEVYPRAAQVPSVLHIPGAPDGAGTQPILTAQGMRADCGAIFFWTKPFEPAAAPASASPE